MKSLSGLVAGGLLLTLAATWVFAQTNTNTNNNNNNNNNGGAARPPVAGPAPRVSRPARIRSPILRLSPQQFMNLVDVSSNTTTLAYPVTQPLTVTSTAAPGGPDGEVSFGEFIAALAVSNQAVNQFQAANLFQLMDHDADGVITVFDFNQAALFPVGT